MTTLATRGRQGEAVKQFSVFMPNRLGRLHDLIGLLGSRSVHVLAITILDTTDSSIVRLVVDDPDNARQLLQENGFPFTESEMLVVEMAAATDLNKLMAALLEAELNINYMYCFIPQSQGKSFMAVSMEDNEVGEKVLKQHAFRVLRQADISR
jgi:hypothetical protein